MLVREHAHLIWVAGMNACAFPALVSSGCCCEKGRKLDSSLAKDEIPGTSGPDDGLATTDFIAAV